MCRSLSRSCISVRAASAPVLAARAAKAVLFPIDALEIDHIIARARGGQDEDANLQLLCPNCNTTKGDKGNGLFAPPHLERRTRESIQEWREKWRREKE